MNAPNVVTTVRTVAAVVLAVLAISQRSAWLAVAAYLTYWLGDMLDGAVARALDRETRFGAVFDIACDRLNCALCIVPLLMFRPQMAVPCAVFLVQFMVIDLWLSLAFLRWPLLSPNYFALVHRGVYRWNWSPPAKALNTSALVLLVVFTPSPWPPTALALAVTAIKLVSLRVVSRLPAGDLPRPAGEPLAEAARA
ncbi:MAG TPA: CDP-alcohol phosphatidyltransferase family protein [Pilimelia sp.]|nr:CDP-alcohol phosphatidyltransferase family protein [Pilimelia sp.]